MLRSALDYCHSLSPHVPTRRVLFLSNLATVNCPISNDWRKVLMWKRNSILVICMILNIMHRKIIGKLKSGVVKRQSKETWKLKNNCKSSSSNSTEGISYGCKNLGWLISLINNSGDFSADPPQAYRFNSATV